MREEISRETLARCGERRVSLLFRFAPANSALSFHLRSHPSGSVPRPRRDETGAGDVYSSYHDWRRRDARVIFNTSTRSPLTRFLGHPRRVNARSREPAREVEEGEEEEEGTAAVAGNPGPPRFPLFFLPYSGSSTELRTRSIPTRNGPKQTSATKPSTILDPFAIIVENILYLRACICVYIYTPIHVYV